MSQQKKRFANDNSRLVLFLGHLRLLTAEASQKLIGGLSIKTQKTWIAPEERYQPRNTQKYDFLFSYLAQSGFNNASFWIMEGGQFTHFWNSIRWFVCRKSSYNLLTPSSPQVTWKCVPPKKSGRQIFRRLERARGVVVCSHSFWRLFPQNILRIVRKHFPGEHFNLLTPNV